ncbi:MAG: hypothetical protein L0177_18945, partial [Chloroflexi bacterium]|nr:hypothetical protein [Chloroflexota bacterium]
MIQKTDGVASQIHIRDAKSGTRVAHMSKRPTSAEYQEALTASGGNKTEAARALGVSRGMLLRDLRGGPISEDSKKFH